MSTRATGMKLLIAIAIGFLIGLVVGFALLYAPSAIRTEAASWLKALGDIFVRLIRIVIPPLIFFTISAAVASIADLRKLGLVLLWMFVLYIGTSLVASILGVVAGEVFQPGVGVGLTPPAGYTPPKPPSAIDILLSFFQLDFSGLLVVGGAMTMIIFAIILGIAVALLGDEGRKLYSFLKLASSVMITMVRVIMYYAPVAIFGYAAWLIAVYGPQMLGAYGKFLLAQYSLSFIHFFIVYSIVTMIGGLSPLKYFKIQSTPFLIAFTTRSSAVTLPYNMEAAKKMGIPDEVYQITLPVGATVNMDGTALYQALSAIFVAQLFGIALTPLHIGLAVASAVIGSVATAAIPGGGTIMLAFVLGVTGLPLEGVGIMLVIDPIADALRTALNVSGDNACSVLITRIVGMKLRSS
ncbi:MAG: dicarboxylate/amino acid:cation symporter [Sulfolobales archaeon]|nr:dicarboxylate/amino acid:cation symporter [Sulfolobales archaeon]MDW8082964.1 dicarboxylate/amino acid:cation symporter [Sulfolobales archaeon]